VRHCECCGHARIKIADPFGVCMALRGPTRRHRTTSAKALSLPSSYLLLLQLRNRSQEHLATAKGRRTTCGARDKLATGADENNSLRVRVCQLPVRHESQDMGHGRLRGQQAEFHLVLVE
jgi:hypothetical protein